MGSYRVKITYAAKREIRNVPGHARAMIFHTFEAIVTVLAIRKRLPYQYDDLEDIIKDYLQLQKKGRG